MRVLALSDIHGNWRGLKEVMDREDYDAILIAGDLSDYSGYVDKVVSVIRDVVRIRGAGVCAVLGNMDSPDLLNKLSVIKEITALHGSLTNCGDYVVVGFSGGLRSPFHTAFELGDDDYKSLVGRVASMLGGVGNRGLILLTHTPPYNTRVDKTFNNLHVGSEALREFIELYKPVVAVCGHIHEGRGIDYIGNTLIVNPGPLFKGFYATLELGNDITYELKVLK